MNAAREPWMQLPALPPALALPMQELLAKVLGESRQRAIKQLMAVGAAGRVGTSFVARHLASQLAPAFGSVLLIEVRPEAPDQYSPVESPAALALGGPVVVITMPQSVCLGLNNHADGTLPATLPADWLDAFGLVLWDVPALTASPVAMVLAREVGGIVMVAQANRTRRHVARHSALRLQESGGRLLGVVLNRTLNFIPGWIYRLL